MNLLRRIREGLGTQSLQVFTDSDAEMSPVDAFYKHASEQILAKALSDRQAAALKQQMKQVDEHVALRVGSQIHQQIESKAAHDNQPSDARWDSYSRWHQESERRAAQDEFLVILAFAMEYKVINTREFFANLSQTGNVGLAALQSLIPPGQWRR